MSLLLMAPPRISKDLFRQILTKGKSPGLPEADVLYDACVKGGVDPACFLAFWKHENIFGTTGVTHDFDLHNPGSVRTPFDPTRALGVVAVPNNGSFAKYATWTLGTADWVDRMRVRYVAAGFDTIERIVPKYAPADDGNNVAAYIAAVNAAVARWSAEDQAMTLDIDTHTYRSPNFNDRPAGTNVSSIVIHTTEGHWPSDAVWLSSSASQVSAQYVIAPDGTIYQLVDDSKRAWHAGVSDYLGLSDYNNFSLGVEASHMQGSTWPEVQRQALKTLCQAKVAQYGIKQSMIVAHRWIAPGRRSDPTDWTDVAFRAWIAELYAASTVDYTKLWGTAYPYNPTFGIETEWRRAAVVLGAATSDEHSDMSGMVTRHFAGGYVRYDPKTNTLRSFFPRPA